jgi:hypothetical protein
MNLLEVFVHSGCIAEKLALALARALLAVWLPLEARIRLFPEASDHVQALRVIVVPTFVLNGIILTVVVPRKAWLVAKPAGVRHHD